MISAGFFHREPLYFLCRFRYRRTVNKTACSRFFGTRCLNLFYLWGLSFRATQVFRVWVFETPRGSEFLGSEFSRHPEGLCFLGSEVWSPGQTDSQVVASWKLGSTCDSVWPGLACTCVDLRWLAIGRDQICTQVNASFLPFGHQTQVSSQVQLAATCDYLRVRLTKAWVFQVWVFETPSPVAKN